MTFGEGEHWLIGAIELRVPMTDVATIGHFAGKSINGVRSHRFLLYNREYMTVLYLACQLLVFLLMQKWICKHKGLILEVDIQSVPVDLTC
jgi:hypothetical protein